MTDYLYNLPNATTGGDTIMLQFFSSFGWFGSLILFFTWMVVFLGGSVRQLSRGGSADYSAWSIIASVTTLLPALLLSINAGYLQLDWLVIVVALNILSAIWFFLDRKVTEV